MTTSDKTVTRGVTNDYFNQKSLTYGIHAYRLKNTLELLRPFTNKKILDIGCSTGYLGQILRKRNNYVVGYDISTYAIQKAKRILNEAYVVNIETDSLSKTKDFDLILLLDIVEHMYHPSVTFKKLVKKLKPGGYVLMSTPNFLYWGYRMKYLLGKFAYTKQGPFDESHIHFFTYTSLLRLLTDAGLSLASENHLCAGRVSGILNKFSPSLFAYHFLLLAKKI